MEKISRNKFFGAIGKGVIATAITAALPIKFFSNVSKTTRQEKIKVAVHPSAIKRNDKV